MTLAFTLFIAGMLTILLPCILPLIPIVVGASIGDRNPWRPLMTVVGMVISFVTFSLVLLVVLRQFVWIADDLRIATYDVLLLFGMGFLTSRKSFLLLAAAVGALFFWGKGWMAIGTAAILGVCAVLIAHHIGAYVQQLGANIQSRARLAFGNTALSSLVIGLTLGLVWAPCAGPSLSFAYALVREQPGVRAAALLFAYASGTTLPLLLIGYGSQKFVHSVRVLVRYSGRVKIMSGVLLIFTAFLLRLGGFQAIQSLLIEKGLGSVGTDIEQRLFGHGL